MLRSVLSADVARGQTVIVFARWLLVLSALVVAAWEPEALPQLRLQIGVILVAAIGNFAMHAQLLRRRPTTELVAYGTSLGDLLLITLLIASQGGFRSNLFVFYFPAILAISVAFPTRPAVALSGIGVGLAAAASWGAPSGADVLLRVIALSAVALIGNAYWRLHRSRIEATTSQRREDAQDLFWGQVATLWARWTIIGGGAVLALFGASSTGELTIRILPVVVLVVVNFYLHGRYLTERPANALLTILATGLDLALVALIFLAAPRPNGLANASFALLYPLVFGVGLVFRPRLSWVYTGLALLLYSALVVLSGVGSAGDAKVLVVRLVTLAAMGGLGSVYWRLARRATRSESVDDQTSATPLAWQPVRAS